MRCTKAEMQSHGYALYNTCAGSIGQIHTATLTKNTPKASTCCLLDLLTFVIEDSGRTIALDEPAGWNPERERRYGIRSEPCFIDVVEPHLQHQVSMRQLLQLQQLRLRRQAFT